MANIFLRSTDGNDANAGTDKGSPKATLQSALTAAGAGGNVYASDLHAETAAVSVSITSPGTEDNPTFVLSVPDWGSDTGTTPPSSLSNGASLTTTTSADNIDLRGWAVSRGFEFHAQRTLSIVNGTGDGWDVGADELECGADGNSAGGDTLGGLFGNADQTSATRITAGALRFSSAGQSLRLGTGLVDLEIGSIVGTIPTTLFEITSLRGAVRVVVRNSDLSALGSGKNLFSASGVGKLVLVNCKLGASVSPLTGSFSSAAQTEFVMVNCDSADTNYRFFRALYRGTEINETTVVRSGGSSDGTTSFARKIDTGSTTIHFPYKSLPIEIWNETTGSSVTVTIATITDGVTLTDAEAWIEAEYLGTSGFPLGDTVTDRITDPFFGTPANQTADGSSSWGGSLSSPVKQELSVTFTPQEKGIIRVYVCVAKASTTVYYDPLVQVS